MTDQQLRALVRDAVARHLGRAPEPSASGADVTVTINVHAHPSHGRYALPSGDEGDEAGPCLIEPAVRCNHCGYCQSHGH